MYLQQGRIIVSLLPYTSMLHIFEDLMIHAEPVNPETKIYLLQKKVVIWGNIPNKFKQFSDH